MIRNSEKTSKPSKHHQLLATTCLGQNKMSTTTALKAHQHHLTAAMAPPFVHNNNNNTATMTMSSLAADLCKAAAAVQQQQAPPMEAVVVNSIIYSKPSFCSIVVDIGGGNATTTMTTTTNSAAAMAAATADKFVGGTKDKMAERNTTKPTPQQNNTWATDKPFIPFANEGFFPMAGAAATASNTSASPEDPDAHVYMMCTTMNGSIHHHISELCDNLIAMGLFGMTNSEHDDDSLIEFAYDDEDDLNQTDDYDEEDEDDDDDDDIETDDDDDCEDDGDDNDDDCLYDAGEDVVDFVKSCPYIKTPNEIYCDKKKKVRFNTKPVVHVMHTWDYAYRAARKGNWEMYARDRGRFKRRICETASVLNPILQPEHRLKIYADRFVNLYAAMQPEVEEEKEKREKVQEQPEKKKIPLQPPPNANTKAKKRQRLKKRRRRWIKF